MRLTQVLLRKRKMNRKPQSFIRSWQWNNAWYLAQERPVWPLGFKESILKRGMALHQPEDIISGIHEPCEYPKIELTETKLKGIPRDENHPLWKETPAYTYGDRTWLPKNNRLQFASAITNSETVANFKISQLDKGAPLSESVEKRVTNLLKDVFVGDAVQKILPRNFRVPYIGWHPVEDKMRPRNLYDHTAFSWGRSMPREYGVPNQRKLANLSRGLFMESVKQTGGNPAGLRCSEDPESHIQFIQRPDGKLVRFNLKLPLAIYGNSPLPPMSLTDSSAEISPVPDMSPLNPLVSLHPTNIYRDISCHPVTNKSHSSPFAHTVFQHYTSHISPNWIEDIEMSRALMAGFAVALGQARLRFGNNVSGDLPEPVRVNVIGTDGLRYILGSVQLNSMDLGSSSTRNLFSYHPEALNLFSYCGYQDGAVVLNDMNMDTLALITSVINDARGNPQLRVFLPNFWMKMIKPEGIYGKGSTAPQNKVQFVVSSGMTRYDIKNYLEKIYKIPVVDVRTVNKMGKTRQNAFGNYLVNDKDYKVAFVTLPEGHKFEWPDLKIKSQLDEMEDGTKEDVENAKEAYAKDVNADTKKYRPGVPSFFGL